MIKFFSSLMLLTPLFIYPLQVLAEPAFVYGAGALKCSEVIELYEEDDKVVEVYLKSWVEGYLSGLNLKSISEEKKYKDLSKAGWNNIKYLIFANCSHSGELPFSIAVDTTFSKLPNVSPLRGAE